MAKENKFRALSDRLRLYLASVETLPLLVVLGICVGLLAGGVIILFRLTIEFSQASFLPRGQTESYESLSAATRQI